MLFFKLFDFFGGVKLPENKQQSTQTSINDLTEIYPEELILPLLQHTGNPAIPLVAVGDYVKMGQQIAIADDKISSSIHASTSGVIKAIELRPVAHPSGFDDLCIILSPDGLNQPIETIGHQFNYKNHDIQHVYDFIQQMGIVGLGGAVFPTHLKMQKPIKTLIINGCECEPYITCDDLLMREEAFKIMQGVEIIADLLQAEQTIIAIEDNKPEAIDILKNIVQMSKIFIQIVVVKTRYPAGSAKQLIKTLTNIEVPQGKRTADFGIQCFNVATAFSISEAIYSRKPLISRIVTMTGEFNQPQNVKLLLGTPIKHIIKNINNLKENANQLIMGGPMMGFNLLNDLVPVVKAMNCILAGSEDNLPELPTPMPCIRCGLCAESCPSELQPMDLYWFSQSKQFKKAEEYHLFDCIECGCCSYVCPSHIPLVDFYRFAKSELKNQYKEQQLANESRERHEFRLERLEREKSEKAQRLAEKVKEKQANSTESDAKKLAIQEALSRVKAKKLAQQQEENS